MFRRSWPLLMVVALVSLSGCVQSGSSGGMHVWSRDPAGSGAARRGADDAHRLDSLHRYRVFELDNLSAVDKWDDASVDWDKRSGRRDGVDIDMGRLRSIDRKYVLGLTARGELQFVGANALDVVEAFRDSFGGVNFFDPKGTAKRELEGAFITAKAGPIEKDALFPYLRAVFQMNGFDLVPTEIPFYGKGFQVVRLEDFDWVEKATSSD